MKRIRTLVLLLGAAAGLLGLAPLAPDARAATTWAPAATATVHPGVATHTEGSGQCTSNFVFQDAGGTYIGQAAHCAGTGQATETDGCLAESLPLGTKVEVDGASRPGTLVYSSWLTMQANGEAHPEACAYNDFALVKLDPADVDSVNPSVPHWGGPVALGGAPESGDEVYSYGNSGLRLGISLLSPKTGESVGTSPGGWSHSVYTISPGIPGDSGSGFLDSSGRAFGTLSTLDIAPMPASNGVSDLARELAYAQANGFPGLQLVAGTEPFVPGPPF